MNPIFRHIFTAVLFTVPAFAQAVAPAPVQQFQFFADSTGRPLAGGKVCSYAAGTTTPLVTYGNSVATPNTNPVILDANGRAGIWLGPLAYKIVLRAPGTTNDCTTGAIIYSVDGIFDPGQKLRADLISTATNFGAALVGFKQTGTGATARTAQTKLQEVFSVKDFGALGDGSTEDSAAFNLATAAVNAAGSGTLLIPRSSGAYRIRKVITGGNITIICDQGVTLKLPDGFNGSNDYMFATSITGAATSNVEIGQGCILDGNRASQSGAAGDGDSIGYLFNGASNTVLHGLLQNFWTDGVYLGCAGASHDIPGDHITLAADLHVTASRRNNVSIICGTNVTFDHPVFDNAGATVGQAGTAPKAGLDIEPNVAANVIRNIAGAFTSHDNFADGFDYFEQFVSRLDSGVNLSCTCYNNANYGGRVETFNASFQIGGVRITGSYFGNGSAGPGYASIVFDGNVVNSVIEGVFNETNAGTVTANVSGPSNTIGDGYYSGETYDFYIDAGCTGCQISTGAKNAHGLDGFVLSASGIKLLAGVSGTFTPTLLFGGASTGITYGTRQGAYYRVGHTLTVTVHLVLTSKGSATGAATISGLPFAAGSYTAGIVGYWASTAGVTYTPTFYMLSGATSGFLEQSNGGTGSQGLLDSNFSDTTEFVLTIAYGL